MTPLEYLSLPFLLLGSFFFFLAGTVGMLRFPDLLTRLHAVTKADNLGLGCIVLGLGLLADNWAVVAKLLLVWLLVLAASAVNSFLLAGDCLVDQDTHRK